MCAENSSARVQSINGSFFPAVRSSRLSPSHHPHTHTHWRSNLMGVGEISIAITIGLHLGARCSSQANSPLFIFNTTSRCSSLSRPPAHKHYVCRNRCHTESTSVLIILQLHIRGEIKKETLSCLIFFKFGKNQFNRLFCIFYAIFTMAYHVDASFSMIITTHIQSQFCWS